MGKCTHCNTMPANRLEQIITYTPSRPVGDGEGKGALYYNVRTVRKGNYNIRSGNEMRGLRRAIDGWHSRGVGTKT